MAELTQNIKYILHTIEGWTHRGSQKPTECQNSNFDNATGTNYFILGGKLGELNSSIIKIFEI